MFDPPLGLTKPGLFITGTDTGVGKTVVTCAIARCLRQRHADLRVSVCKPFASGCRLEGDVLVSEDVEALAHFAGCEQPLKMISPLRWSAPLAPAPAAESAGQTIDCDALAGALRALDNAGDVLLVEGIGGLCVPIDPANPSLTTLDLIAAIAYPVVVVTRAGLGTLNHTAMTVRLLRQAGCDMAGLVVNAYESAGAVVVDDPSVASNAIWMTRMTGVPVLATTPACAPDDVVPHEGRLASPILDAMRSIDWRALMR